MTDPRKTVQDAALTALIAAGLTVYEDPAQAARLPYTTVSDLTAIPGIMTTKGREGGEVTITLVSWSTTKTEALANASTGLAALTNRSAPIALASPWNMSQVFVDLMGSPIKDDQQPNTAYWGVPYRIRVWLYL